MNPQETELYKAWSYEFKVWRQNEWFDPKKLVASADVSEAYEMDKASLFQNKNGSYVLVYESGCSCYEASDAKLELFSSLKSVKDRLKGIVESDKWMSRDSRKALLAKLTEKAN